MALVEVPGLMDGHTCSALSFSLSPTLKALFLQGPGLVGVLCPSLGPASTVTGSLSSQMWTNVSLDDIAMMAIPPASTSSGVSAASASQAG